MERLVDRCRALVELSGNLDPEAVRNPFPYPQYFLHFLFDLRFQKTMVKAPLKKIDKCVAKPGLEAGLQCKNAFLFSPFSINFFSIFLLFSFLLFPLFFILFWLMFPS